jgi:N-acylneuraminate cytidylyltransferase
MNLCVIPARGGSKRIHRKNIKQFCGKPLIVWSIEKAIESGCFDKIIVSTDDIEIANIAKNYGAEVPFIRPKELSDDYTSTNEVISHAIKFQIKNSKRPSIVCCIYPTAPFVQTKDLKHGLEILKTNGVDYVFSVTTFAYPIQRSFRMTKDQKIEMFWPEFLYSRSQDLEEAWHDAGQFYWGITDSWLENKPIISKNAKPIHLPRYRVQDIDTYEDWERAEWMFKVINKQKI